jgi:16S rRNA (cytosine1402-N4)-methyltransferase
MSEPMRRRPGGSGVHRPVLLREVVEHLVLAPGLVVVDGTVGSGGHSAKILERIGPTGMLVGFDRDPMMLGFAAGRLVGGNVVLRQASHSEMKVQLAELGITAVDRVLLDLGLSSDQLADDSRGFGFESAGELDLRFDTSRGEPVWQLLERVDEDDLRRWLDEYGEEKFSRRIAAAVVARRSQTPIRTAKELTEVVLTAVPAAARREARKHPATRVFQALRIAVNEELDHVRTTVGEVLPVVVKPGGRAVVVSFHSLEDRLVKEAFRGDAWQTVTNKPVTATPAEQRLNPRSRTARLRTAVRR